MTLTPGQEALCEAARLESARVYGRTVPERRTLPAGLAATVAEAVLTAPRGNRVDADVAAAIRDGAPTSQLVDLYGLTYAEARAARKRVMASGAA